ncbi:hypothetical protein ABZZ80_46930, partial [Streptomyces sp. NPDC006356]
MQGTEAARAEFVPVRKRWTLPLVARPAARSSAREELQARRVLQQDARSGRRTAGQPRSHRPGPCVELGVTETLHLDELAAHAVHPRVPAGVPEEPDLLAQNRTSS